MAGLQQWQDFGQRVDLTARIREILLNYPEGTSIFKELIQGPALLVRNDASFSDADFQSISSVGNSVKRAMSGKTGRYGIGFSAVYHLTDVPSFVSGRHLAIFDPHCKFLPGLAADNPGKRIDFVANPLGHEFRNQFEPYMAFGCDMRSHFDGTLFRFPLRSEVLADTSRISKQVYTIDKMRAQLEALASEASALLLFLRNVERCEVLVWPEGAQSPQLLHECIVQGVSTALRRQRALFQAAGRSEAILEVHQMALASTDHRTGATRTQTFLIGQSNAGGDSGPLAILAAEAGQAFGAPLTPWGAVAAALDDPGAKEGRAYCFLPLPVKTGLPAVHINSLFELSSNRRDIWSGSDMTGSGARRSEWNLRLLEEVIAPLYAHVLGEAARRLGPGGAYQRLWPLQPLQPPWDRLLTGFLLAIPDQPVVPSVAASGPRWLTPRQAVFADAVAAREEDLMAALTAVGMPLPALPPATTELLLRMLPTVPQLLTPSWLRDHLRARAAGQMSQNDAAAGSAHGSSTSGDSAAAAAAAASRSAQMSTAHATALLRYAMADIDDSDAEMVRELAGLPLLPLATGGLATLQLEAAMEAGGGDSGNSRANGMVYLAAPEDEVLLAAAPRLLFDQAAAGAELAARLGAIAALGVLNVRLLSVTELPALLPVLLPAAWRSAALGASDLSAFSGWPLLPLRGGCLAALVPGAQSTVICPGTGPEWTPALLDTLEVLGCRLLATQPALQHPQLSAHVHRGDGAGVLAALAVILSTGEPAEAVFDRQCIAAKQRRALRGQLLQQQWLVDRPGREPATADAALHRRHTLQQLPIFESAASAAAQAPAAPAASVGTDADAADQLPPAGDAAPRPPSPELDAGSRMQKPVFMDLLGERFTAPAGIPATALPDCFVAVDGETEPAALALLGVHRPTRAQVYRQHIFPRLASLPHETGQIAMLGATRELPQLAAEDANIVRHMRGLAFVATASGRLRKPNALYDPRVAELRGLLDAASAFPAGPWAEAPILAALSVLGLQTAVGPAALVEVARQVEATSAGSPAAAAARGKALLAYLDVEAGRLARSMAAAGSAGSRGSDGKSGSDGRGVGSGSLSLNSLFSHVGSLGKALLGADATSSSSGQNEDHSSGAAAPAGGTAQALWHQLRAINWCPVLTEPPDALVPWTADTISTVAAPAAVRPANDLQLASATRRILAGDCRSPALLEGLGWSCPPDASTLAAQLRALGQKHSGGSSGDGSEAISADKRRALAVAVPQLLQALSEVPPEQLHSVTGMLADAPVIWTGASFTSIDRIAFRHVGPLSLDPWLYVTPLDLAPFAPLLRRLGVADGFSAAQYARVLQGMAAQHGQQPLGGKSLGQALGIVQALSSMDVGGQQVFLPDDRGVLLPAGELIYDDTPWLASAAPARRTAHPQISNEVAKALGVASMRGLLLAVGADPFRLEASEAFGQSEALTTRLKHITDAYADGPGVLLELVQNADDAGASEVAFMLDGRSYPTDSVLGPGLAAWQGPALCCYNDAVFSAADLRAISRIGQDSKLDKPQSIGRFGLGWNGVYHFTDVPSFCSGDNLVLFDPHAKYLPGISAAQPGLRIGFERAGLATQFPDAVAPYRHFGCDARRRFPGTLFRFPLRTKELAAASEIKHTAYRPADVLELFSAFERQAAHALLFLKSVRTLSVYSSDGSAEEPRLLFRFRLQGKAHPQEAVTRFVHDADREALLRRLAAMAPENLPSSVGTATISQEDAAGNNRRELWLGTDMAGTGARRAAWNIALLSEGVATAYAQTLLRAAEMLGPTPEYYALWPMGQLSQPWTLLAEALYQKAAQLLVLWCPATAGAAGRWAAPVEAVLPDEACRADAALFATLLAAGVPLADAATPPALCQMLLGHAPGAAALHPALLRRRLAASGWRFAGTEAEAQAAAPLLLEQCMGDVLDEDPDSAALLAGLPLAPLADERRGTLQLAAEAGSAGMLYVASEEDVSLLGGAQAHMLVRAAGALQQRLAAIAASGALNLAPLSAAALADVFLPAMLPPDWRGAAEVEWTPGADGHPTAEALSTLWRRISAFSPADAQRFRGLPLVPVAGGLLAAPALLPVVSQGAWAAGVGSSLRKLGCRLLAAATLPGSMAEVHQFVLPASGAGVLAAIRAAAATAVANSVGTAEAGDATVVHTAAAHFEAAGLEAAERTQLREFLLQERWFEQTGGRLLSAAATSTLKQLPIFCCGPLRPPDSDGPGPQQAAMALPTLQTPDPTAAAPDLVGQDFTGLTPDARLAPAGTAQALLTSPFVIPSSQEEAGILIRHLGVPQLDRFVFAAQHLLRHAAALPAGPRDEALAMLLKKLAEAPEELRQQLPKACFVSTASGRLQSPSELFDPRNDELAALLDAASAFPGPVFSSDDQASCSSFDGVLAALAQLGMRTAVSLQVLVDVARQLEAAAADVAADSAAAQAAGATATLHRRAAALLDHLDRAAQHEGSEGHVELWTQLTRLAWCPVLAAPPAASLPWPAASRTRAQQAGGSGGAPGGQPAAQQLPPLAPPRLTRPPANLWLVSAGSRVVDAPEGWAPSAALAHRLGWDQPPSPNVLAVQLLELGQLHLKVREVTTAGMLTGVTDQLYGALGTAMADAAAGDVIKATLEGGAWVWVGNGFTTAAAAALQGIPDSAAPLQTVPADLAERHHNTLTTLGVAQEPGATQFAHALARLAARAAGLPASARQVGAAAGLAELLAACILQGEALADVPLVLPDAEGVFAPAAALCVNDAAWLPAGGARLVHPDVPLHAAEALGAQSLRFHHQVSTDHTQQLPCPPAAAIAAALTAQQARGLEALCDIAEVAEAAGAKTLELWLDARQHPAQSMLLPGLAAFQGPAICVNILGVVLDDRELSELQLPRRQPFQLRGNTCGAGAGLLAAYTLTDLPVVLPGDSLCMWDPSGGILSSSPRSSASGGLQPLPQPQGRKFRFTGTDLPTHFAHQFAPWDFGGSVGGARGVDGTLLRLALRSEAQAVDNAAHWSVESAARLLEEFAEIVGPSLLFLRHLQRVRVMRWDADAVQPMPVAQVAVTSRGPDEKHIFDESRRSGIAALGDRLRTQRPGKTRLQWRHMQRQLGLSALLPVPGEWAVPLAADDATAKLVAPFEMPFHIAGHFLPQSGLRKRAWQGPSDDPAARFNAELLACVRAAWMEAFRALLEAGAANLYSLVPPAAALAAARPLGLDYALAEKVCQDVAAKQVWRLRSGRVVGAADAAFLQSGGGGVDMGPAALAWLLRQAPLHEASGGVKADLEAAGVTGLSSVAPASVRTMLKRVAGKRGEAAGAVTAAEAAELLRFCFADVFDSEAPAEPIASPAQAAGLEGEVAAAVAAVQRGMAGGLAAARGLLQEAQAAANEGGLPALGDWAAQHVGGAGGAAAADTASTAGSDGVVAAAVYAARGAYVAQRVRDCAGLPAPTGGGAVVALGSRQLFTWPPGMAVTPLDVFPTAAADLAGQFLGRNVVRHLGHHLAAAAVAEPLKVQQYSLVAAERHLPALLPPPWAPRPLGGAARAPPPATPLPWHAHLAPSRQQLQALWQMLSAVQQHGSGRADNVAAWDALTEWALLPLAAGGVMRMCHRALVFAAPSLQTAEAPLPLGPELPQQAGQPASTPQANQRAELRAGGSFSSAAGASPGATQSHVHSAATAADTLVHGIAALGLEAPLHAAGAGPPTTAGNDNVPAAANLHRESGNGGLASAASEDQAAATGAAGPEGAASAPEAAQPAAMGGQPAGMSAARPAEAAQPAPPPQHPEAQLWAWLTPLLLRLGLPVLHPDFAVAAPACRPAAASPTEPTEDVVLHKLRLCSDAGLLKAEAMASDDRKRLLLYFAARVPGGLQADDASFLLRLPIFPGIAHSAESPAWRPLTEAAAAAAAPAAEGGGGGSGDAAVCPQAALDAVCGGWADLPLALQGRLLQHDAALGPLFQRLSVPVWDAAELLAQGMLPAWPALQQPTQQRVLAYIERNWGAIKLDGALKTALAAAPFVDTGVEGAATPPNELFDPRSRLLGLVFAGQPVFPVGRFASASWLKMLQEVGLRHEVDDAETFTACARRVAAAWAEAPGGHQPAAAARAAMQAAQLLAAHLAAKADALFSPHLFHELGSIAFVPALKAVPGHSGGEEVLTYFSAAAAPADWALAWAAAPVLQDGSVPPTYAWTALKLRSPPVASTVIAHLRAVGAGGGEGLLAAWPAGRPAPDAAFAAVATYLTNQGLPAAQVLPLLVAVAVKTPATSQLPAMMQAAELGAVPLVPVAAGSRLIAPSRLFARLPQDLAPFAYELPAGHRRWDALLRGMGMRDAPAPGDLLQLAADVAAAAGGGPLNANERGAALRLLGALCDDADAAQIKATRQAAARRRVPVLTADGRLAPAVACVHTRTAPRSLLRRVDMRRLALAHPKLGAAVAAALCIPALEDTVAEVLDPFGSDRRLQAIQGLSLTAAQQKLALPAFAAAACDVLRSCADATPALQALPLQEVARRLAALARALQFSERCYTRIVRRADGTEAGDALQVPFFVDTSTKSAVVAEPPAGVPVAAALAAAVSAALGSPLPLPLEPLLAAEATRLPALAAALAPGGAADATGGVDIDRLAAAGTPGMPLLPADAACAHLLPLRAFSAGEVCAFSPAAASARAAPDQPLPQLLYARVTADARPAAGQPLHRIPLEVAPGKYAELLSTRVWCFGASSGAAHSNSGNSAAASQAAVAVPSANSAAAASAAAGRPAAGEAGGGSGGGEASNDIPAAAAASVPTQSPTASGGPAASVATGAIGPAEAAAAVADMLAAAGLPAGADSTELLAQALALRAERDELRQKAGRLQQELATASDAAESAATAWQCRICLGAPVDAAMKECGHTLCRGCAASVPGRCAFCRKSSAVIRLYNG